MIALAHRSSLGTLVLEEVVNHLESLFAPIFAQDSSSGKKYGSIVLESDRDVFKLL